jgi:hypothetical protein
MRILQCRAIHPWASEDYGITFVMPGAAWEVRISCRFPAPRFGESYGENALAINRLIRDGGIPL